MANLGDILQGLASGGMGFAQGMAATHANNLQQQYEMKLKQEMAAKQAQQNAQMIPQLIQQMMQQIGGNSQLPTVQSPQAPDQAMPTSGGTLAPMQQFPQMGNIMPPQAGVGVANPLTWKLNFDPLKGTVSMGIGPNEKIIADQMERGVVSQAAALYQQLLPQVGHQQAAIQVAKIFGNTEVAKNLAPTAEQLSGNARNILSQTLAFANLTDAKKTIDSLRSLFPTLNTNEWESLVKESLESNRMVQVKDLPVDIQSYLFAGVADDPRWSNITPDDVIADTPEMRKALGSKAREFALTEEGKKIQSELQTRREFETGKELRVVDLYKPGTDEFTIASQLYGANGAIPKNGYQWVALGAQQLKKKRDNPISEVVAEKITNFDLHIENAQRLLDILKEADTKGQSVGSYVLEGVNKVLDEAGLGRTDRVEARALTAMLLSALYEIGGKQLSDKEFSKLDPMLPKLKMNDKAFWTVATTFKNFVQRKRNRYVKSLDDLGYYTGQLGPDKTPLLSIQTDRNTGVKAMYMGNGIYVPLGGNQ